VATLKISLLVAFATIFSTAGQACNLTNDDFEALAGSPSHLTSGEFSALSPEGQELVCSTRAIIKKIDAQKGVMNKSEMAMKYNRKYLMPAEVDRLVVATNKYLCGPPCAAFVVGPAGKSGK
jgi:hypothetical protein